MDNSPPMSSWDCWVPMISPIAIPMLYHVQKILMTRPGKRFDITVTGKIHYFFLGGKLTFFRLGHIFNSFWYVYQRVSHDLSNMLFTTGNWGWTQNHLKQLEAQEIFGTEEIGVAQNFCREVTLDFTSSKTNISEEHPKFPKCFNMAIALGQWKTPQLSDLRGF